LTAKTGEIPQLRYGKNTKYFRDSAYILEKYRKSFHESELGRLHSVFPFERIAKESGLSEQRLGRKNIFSLCAKIGLMVLKAYTGFSDRQLVAHLRS